MEHAALKVSNKSTTEENQRLLQEQRDNNATLKISNEVRQKAEDNLIALQQQYRSVKDAFSDRESTLAIFRKKFDEEQKKLTQIERKADTLEIEKKSLEK